MQSRCRRAERTLIAHQIRLTVISEPAPGTKAVIDRRSEATIVYRGRENDTAYLCGSCASPLIVGLDARKFHGVVIKCNHCKSFNAVEPLRSAESEADATLE